MGQVYQATDTKLNRQVTLKILPEAFAADPDRLARDSSEKRRFWPASTILNIAADPRHRGVRTTREALVLELVEGPTLGRPNSPRDRSQLRKPFRSRSRSLRRWKRPMRQASSTAT